MFVAKKNPELDKLVKDYRQVPLPSQAELDAQYLRLGDSLQSRIVEVPAEGSAWGGFLPISKSFPLGIQEDGFLKGTIEKKRGEHYL